MAGVAVFLLRIVVNAAIVAAELGIIAGAAWLAFANPVLFAGATALLTFVLGWVLEAARLRYELPFYFNRTLPGSRFIAAGIALVEAALKGILAGAVALLAFSGTDEQRLMWVAVVFAVCVLAGSSLLRLLSISFGARPLRWGYFRLAAPLGLLFSIGLGLLVQLGLLRPPALSDLGRQLVLEMPKKPSLAQASEFLFGVKQYIDAFIVGLLENVTTPTLARVISMLISVNVLTGFVIAIYAVMISELVRLLEERS